MKKNRQEAIIELIQQYPIETQEELLSRLNQIGFKTTQATISRDIRELALIKKPARRLAAEIAENNTTG